MPDIDTMPGALKSSGAPAKPKASSKPTANTKRLVLCFDGTGNTFQGNPSDTNIVKLLNMFDHTAKDQDHYYQRMQCSFPYTLILSLDRKSSKQSA